jgi:hypothetical protein
MTIELSHIAVFPRMISILSVATSSFAMLRYISILSVATMMSMLSYISWMTDSVTLQTTLFITVHDVNVERIHLSFPFVEVKLINFAFSVFAMSFHRVL